MLKVTFMAVSGGQSEQLELSETLDLNELRDLLAVIFDISSASLMLFRGNTVLPNSGTLQSVGVEDQALLIVADSETVRRNTGQGSRLAARPIASTPRSSLSSSGARSKSGPVFWQGISLDEVMSHNANPEHIVDILQKNEVILRELGFHDPKLASAMGGSRDEAIQEMRRYMLMNATSSTMDRLTAEKTDREMENRLRINPMDTEANQHFGEKIRKAQVEESFVKMMTNYPESITKVLMLYVEVRVNGVALQAFVDSGAQTSIMSSACAEKCNIVRLIDTRFAGNLVGVGTGRSLGRVHIVDMKIGSNFFPITVTVTDDSKGGMGDKNMEFCLGLDMLRRHRACIDLAQGKLIFNMTDGIASAPFLHEKDLPENKGGTKGLLEKM